MKPIHHYIIHAVLLAVIVYLAIEPKQELKTVSKTLYDAKINDIEQAKQERDSIAVLLGRAKFRIDSIKNRPIEKEVIYITRKDEISLIKSRDLLDSVRSAISE